MVFSTMISPKTVTLRSFVVMVFFVVTVRSEEDVLSSPIELDNMLRFLLTPDDIRSLQAQALRQELFRILMNQEAYQDPDEDLIDDDKRSLSSLARSGNFPYSKRNIEALARSGYLKVPPQEREVDEWKRSIATLAKNGQLPNYSLPEDTEEIEDNKRSIEALARNGYLSQKREQLNELLNELTDKRSIASLAKSYNLPGYGKRNLASLARGSALPYYGKRYLGALARGGGLRNKKEDYDVEDKRHLASIVRGNGKRSLASLIRNNDMPYSGKRGYYEDFKRNIGSIARGMSYTGKRNVAALLRQTNYLDKEAIDPTQSDDGSDMDKRNIGSVKAHMQKRSANEHSTRNKRQATDYPFNDEYSVPVYQNTNVYDYEDLMQALTGEYPNTEKRFLGSVARSGWFRSPSTSRYHTPGKRHIGSLARLGWLPAFRNVRRFSRSGRSGQYDDQISDYRSYTTDGTSSENDRTNPSGTLEQVPVRIAGGVRRFAAPLPGAKRYLLLPAVDNILLRKAAYRGHPHATRECL